VLLEIPEEIGELQLAAERNALVPVRDRFVLPGAVADDEPSGRSAATIFHTALLSRSDRFSQASCAGPKIADEASSVVCRFGPFAPL
jgi:hypothetical protein